MKEYLPLLIGLIWPLAVGLVLYCIIRRQSKLDMEYVLHRCRREIIREKEKADMELTRSKILISQSRQKPKRSEKENSELLTSLIEEVQDGGESSE